MKLSPHRIEARDRRAAAVHEAGHLVMARHFHIVSDEDATYLFPRARIRRKLLDDGHIDTVIGLPANLFYSTGIPVCILVLKKCKRPDDVLFINAAEHFVRGKRQNQLTDQHIENIVTTYQHRKEQDRYARRVSMKEIAEKDYNLNISRYISTALEEAEVDLAATHAELVRIEGEIARATAKHNEFLKELGLPLLPFGQS